MLLGEYVSFALEKKDRFGFKQNAEQSNASFPFMYFLVFY
jgi:hypothetical protein